MWRVYNLRHTTVFTYSHANTPLGQSERAYYLSYFIIDNSIFEIKKLTGQNWGHMLTNLYLYVSSAIKISLV